MPKKQRPFDTTTNTIISSSKITTTTTTATINNNNKFDKNRALRKERTETRIKRLVKIPRTVKETTINWNLWNQKKKKNTSSDLKKKKKKGLQTPVPQKKQNIKRIQISNLNIARTGVGL